MRQLAAVSSRFAVGTALLLGLMATPVLAAPAQVSGMTYDATQRQIAIGLSGTVTVRTQRIKNPDRLVFDLNEASLPIGQPVPVVQVPAGNVRSVRIGQNSYLPPVVRVVVDLVPGFEPLVKIEQAGGALRITLANPPRPRGEKDLETLPSVMLPGMPVPASPPEVKPVGTMPNPPSRPPVLPNPGSEPPVLPPSQPSSQPAGGQPAVPTPTWTPPPRVVPTAPTPAWTPPPVPAWTPPSTPPSTPRSWPPTPAPASGPEAPSPVGPSPVGSAPVRSAVEPHSGPPVIIPEDVRPATPPPTPLPELDPFVPAWPAPTPTPAPRAPGELAEADPSGEDIEPSETSETRSVLPPDRRPSASRGSTFQLRWQQVETLEEYGAPEPSFAYPAGINGFELEHWFWPYVGAGFDTRILFYDLTVETVRQHRTDATLGTYLALRYPIAFLEPSLRVGYMGRSVTVESESTGTSFAFSPLQTYVGPTVTGRLKVALLPGLGLDLHAKYMPSIQGSLYPGFPSVFPLSGTGWGASLVTDLWLGYVSLGYSSEQAVNGDGGFKQTFGGITMGMGLRY